MPQPTQMRFPSIVKPLLRQKPYARYRPNRACLPYLALLPFLALTMYGLTSERLLGYHHFRQAHTAMTAHNYAFHSANLFSPSIDGITYNKEPYLNEFPLYPYLVSGVWRLIGESVIAARTVSILFAIGALLFYRRLLRRSVRDDAVADVALVVFSMTPVIAYFSTAVQRQSLFLCSLLAGLFYTLRYLDELPRRSIVPGTLALALAFLLNPFAVYLAIPLLWYSRYRAPDSATVDGETGARTRMFVAAVASVVPAICWYVYAYRVGASLETGSMAAIAHRLDTGHFLSASSYGFWFEADSWISVYRTMVRYVLPFPLTIALFAAGLWCAPREEYGLFKVWLAAVVIYFLLDFYPIADVVHHYYYMNIAPLTALFFAYAVVELTRLARSSYSARHSTGAASGFAAAARRMRPFVFSLAAVMGAATFALGACVTTLWMGGGRWHAEYYPVSERLATVVAPDDRVSIVVEQADPLLSYLVTPHMLHRLVAYHPQRFDELLAARDFDYIAVVLDRDGPLRDDVRRRIESDGRLGPAIVEEAQLLVYRRY